MVGIIGSMDIEIEKLLENMKDIKESMHGPFKFFCGKILNKNVVLVKCFEGKVNSAICTQLLIENFNVDLIINVGVAGGLSKKLEIGGIAISSSTVEFDNDTTALGYELGYTFGINKVNIECDEKEVNRLYDISKNLVNTQKGVIVSSDKFVADDDTKMMLKEKFNAIATDMETASINHVCYLNNIKFIAIRGISDSGNNVEFREFINIAVDNINKVIMEYLK